MGATVFRDEMPPGARVFAGNAVAARSAARLPFPQFRHLRGMTVSLSCSLDVETFPPDFLRVRKPPEPSPPPIKEPPDAPENPDAPVREPDPDEPAQM